MMRKSICLLAVICLVLVLGLCVPALADTTVKAGTTTWSGTMVVSNNVTVQSRVRVNGTATLVLNAGKTLNVPEGIFVTTGNTLIIQGSGTLNAGSETSMNQTLFCAGIGGGWANYSGGTFQSVTDPDCGTVIINGGTINAWGNKAVRKDDTGSYKGGFSAGIGGGAAFVSGGKPQGGSGGTIIINGGTVKAWGYDGGAGIGGGGGYATIEGEITTNGGGATVTINGGTVTASTGGDFYFFYGAGIGSGNCGSGYSITIGDTANVTASSDNGGAGIGGGVLSKSGSVVIEGNADINACSNEGAGIGGGFACETASVTIRGTAKVTAEGNDGGAGIGAANNSKNYHVVIGGHATVHAISKNYGAGIGGGVLSEGGSVRIEDDATVYATGEIRGAGIGGGNESVNDSVTISGNAIVNATGKSYSAGIGGGCLNENGSVSVIIGGNATVNATGESYGAGIGGGLQNSNVSVTIEGNANVTAVAQNIGAGIGSAYMSENTSVTIGGDAHVTATGELQGAGIGGGFYTKNDSVIIEGNAVITAVSKKNGAGIGGGFKSEGDTIIIRNNADITADGLIAGAGIGGGIQSKVESITIQDDARVKAISFVRGAGIGSGYNGTIKTITIEGEAKVTAESYCRGAGIGGGELSTSGGGTILIRGNPEITVTAANATEYSGGAGIGTGNFLEIGYNMNCIASNIIIEGGTLNVTGGDNAAGIGGGAGVKGGKITIKGGNIRATGGLYAAGIGGGLNSDGGIITIDGGSVTAVNGSHGAGIGGGWGGNGGTITIRGGTVNATAIITEKPVSGSIFQQGAAIGGGSIITHGVGSPNEHTAGGNGGTIKIEGGKVTANSTRNGAGIGGGNGGSGGNITITGGEIIANGGQSAAGIGAGLSGSGGNITITGGDITSTGGMYAAGIGGSSNDYEYGTGNCGTLVITGGNVRGIGGYYGAGIGNGYKANDGTISISGGNVIATAGQYGADIGGGYQGGGNTIEISGGNVDAASYQNRRSKSCAGIGGGRDGSAATIRISGGTVSAYAFDTAFWAKGMTGNVELSYTPASMYTMSVCSNSYNGTVTIADGQYFTSGYAVYSSTDHNLPYATLTPWNGLSVSIAEGLQGRVSVDRALATTGQTINVKVDLKDQWVLEKLYYTTEDGNVTEIPSNNGNGSFIMPEQNVQISAVGDHYRGSVINPGNLEIIGNESAPQSISWTASVNPNCTLNLSGKKIRATIAAESQSFLTMDGEGGLSVSYQDKAGTELESCTIAWDRLTDYTPTAWTYSLGQSSSYKPQEFFTFQTSVNQSQVMQANSSPVAAINLDLIDENDNILLSWRLSCRLLCKLYYLDENGSEQICENYSPIDDNADDIKSGWYVVNRDVTLKKRPRIKGDVHLILCDGKTLHAPEGIRVPAGYSLTIYTQSTMESTMGKLTGSTIGDSSSRNDIGTITINGGWIEVVGASNKNAPGIGCKNEETPSSGKVVINGGMISATGSRSGAGIGGGGYSSGPEIIINGGIITARGGENGGAGIGSGSDHNDTVAANRITITGGTVTATGAKGSAGIGGGRYANATNITIAGGSVTATGIDGGAGIGGGGGIGPGLFDDTAEGDGGAGGNITITGGTVIATGSKREKKEQGGAGIGGGAWGKGGTVTISGGCVTATGACGGYGIGGGESYSDGTLTLSWTDATKAGMSVTAGSYSGTVMLEKHFMRVDDSGIKLIAATDSADNTILGSGTLLPADNVLMITCEESEFGTIETGSLFALPGETIAVTVTPDTDNHYIINSVYYSDGTDDFPVARDSDGVFTFTMPECNVTVSATFRRVYTVSFACGEGSGEKTPETVISDDEYMLPASDFFIAPMGQRFKEWSVIIDGADPVTMNPEDVISVTADILLTAVFEPEPYQIAVSAENGTVTADKQTAFLGDTVTLTVEPDQGCHPASLIVKFGMPGEETEIETLNTGENTWTFIQPAGNVNVSAVFAWHCMVYFVDWNGRILQHVDLPAGEIPEYSEETPDRQSNAQYDFTFAGWEPEIGPIPEGVSWTVYTATYTESLRSYPVTFADWNGDVLQAADLSYGDTPAYTGQAPTRETDAFGIYAFSGWTPEIVPVEEEVVYTAMYDVTPFLSVGRNAVILEQYEMLSCLFTPEETGYYRFQSETDPAMPKVIIYDGDNLLTRDLYCSGGNFTFDCTAELTGGKTYTVKLITYECDTELAFTVTKTDAYSIALDTAIPHGEVVLENWEGAHAACEGRTVYVCMSPEDGYGRAELIVTDANGCRVDTLNNACFIMPASAVTVSARFEAMLPITTVTGGPLEMGLISADGLMQDLEDACAIPCATVEMIFMCNEDYEIESVAVTASNGKKIAVSMIQTEENDFPTYRFIMPGVPVTVHVDTIEKDPPFGEAAFVLPAAIQSVEESAFEGNPAIVSVEIPENCMSIGQWAFRDCVNLKKIRVPEECDVGANAFAGCKKVFVYSTKFSPAWLYCQCHDNCVFISETEESPETDDDTETDD